MNLFDALVTAVEEDPENWDLRLQVAETLAEAGKRAEAISLVGSGSVAQGVTEEVAARIEKITGLKLEISPGADEDREPEAEIESEEKAAAAVEDAADVASAEEPEKVEYSSLEFSANQQSSEDPETARIIQTLDASPEWRLSEGRPSDTREKLSSLTVAILVHVGLLILVGLVSVALPRIDPPQIVAFVTPEAEEDQIDPKQVQKMLRQPPTSAAPSATSLVTPDAVSLLSIPSISTAQTHDLTLGLEGIGTGLSLGVSYVAGGKESNVNFFGIKSSAKRMVFIIDAERYMLTDTKGGMPAYDKVKEEISSLLTLLNSSTAFNVILYEGSKLRVYAEELVPAKPSHVRRAGEWLLPVNTDYAALGLRNDYNREIKVQEHEGMEIPANRVSGYVKAIQVAMQMDAHAVFVISSGWRTMGSRPASPEQIAAYKIRRAEYEATGGPAKWNAAVAKARAWLAKENAARREQGIAQKVMTSLSGVARKLSPGVSGPPGVSGRAYSRDDAIENIKATSEALYEAVKKPKPKVNFVLFLGEDEKTVRYEDHYKDVTRKTKGKLKILQGLGALQNVTGG